MANPKTKKKAKVVDTTPTVAETRKAEADKGLLQRVDTPAVSTAPKTTIEGLKGEDIKVADPLVTASLERIKEQEDAKKVENTIKDTYNSPLMSLGAKISEMEEAKKNAKANDETAQRRARSMQMVAGISDGLASLANLIGVGHYDSSNINTGNSLSPLAQKMEAARLERKADIKSIDDRLEQYRNQLDQLRMQKGSALANLYQQRENQAFQRDMANQKILADMKTTEAKLRSAAMENALNRANQLNIAKTRAEATKSAAETKANTTREANAKKNMEEFIVKDADGNESIVSMPKETAKAIMNDFENIIAKDLLDPENTELKAAHDKYQQLVLNRSFMGGDTQEILDARKALISLSPTMQERIKQYGVGADSTSTTTNPTPGASSEAGKKWRQRGH
jgi:hypothetical protein